MSSYLPQSSSRKSNYERQENNLIEKTGKSSSQTCLWYINISFRFKQRETMCKIGQLCITKSSWSNCGLVDHDLNYASAQWFWKRLLLLLWRGDSVPTRYHLTFLMAKIAQLRGQTQFCNGVIASVQLEQCFIIVWVICLQGLLFMEFKVTLGLGQ